MLLQKLRILLLGAVLVLPCAPVLACPPDCGNVAVIDLGLTKSDGANVSLGFNVALPTPEWLGRTSLYSRVLIEDTFNLRDLSDVQPPRVGVQFFGFPAIGGEPTRLGAEMTYEPGPNRDKFRFGALVGPTTVNFSKDGVAVAGSVMVEIYLKDIHLFLPEFTPPPGFEPQFNVLEVVITPVPEPAAVGLYSTGLLVFLLLGIRNYHRGRHEAEHGGSRLDPAPA